MWVHLWRGEVEAARRLRDRLAFLVEHANPEYDDLSRAADAALLRVNGQNAEALTLLRRVVAGSGRSSDDVYTTRWVLSEAAEAAFALDDRTAVDELAREVADRFRRGLSPALDGQLSRLWGRLAAMDGRHNEVADHLREAADLFDGMHMPFWAAIARTEHGEWLAEQGRTDEARDLLARAAATFEELGAAPMLARVRGGRSAAALPA